MFVLRTLGHSGKSSPTLRNCQAMEDWIKIDGRLKTVSFQWKTFVSTWKKYLVPQFVVGLDLYLLGVSTALRDVKNNGSLWKDSVARYAEGGRTFAEFLRSQFAVAIDTLFDVHTSLQVMHNHLMRFELSLRTMTVVSESGELQALKNLQAGLPALAGAVSMFVLELMIFHFQDKAALRLACRGLETSCSHFRYCCRYSLVLEKIKNIGRVLPGFPTLQESFTELRIVVFNTNEAYSQEIRFIDNAPPPQLLQPDDRLGLLLQWTREMAFGDCTLSNSGLSLRSLPGDIPELPSCNSGTCIPDDWAGLIYRRCAQVRKELPCSFPELLWEVVQIAIVEVTVLYAKFVRHGIGSDAFMMKTLSNDSAIFLPPEDFANLFGEWWLLFEIFLNLFSVPSEKGGAVCVLSLDHKKLMPFSEAMVPGARVSRVFPLISPSRHASKLFEVLPPRLVRHVLELKAVDRAM